MAQGSIHLRAFGILWIGIIILQVTALDPRYRCPPHLHRDEYLKTKDNKCYHFIPSEDYWHHALKNCRKNGGTLVEIRESATQNFILRSLHDLNWRRNGLWIGAHDKNHESYWEWASGGVVTWNNWADDQHGCCFGAFEDCAVLRFSDGGTWHDYPCRSMFHQYSYICQFDMLPTTTTKMTTHSTTTTSVPSSTKPNTTSAETSTVVEKLAIQLSRVVAEHVVQKNENNIEHANKNLLQKNNPQPESSHNVAAPLTEAGIYTAQNSVVVACITGLAMFLIMSLCITLFIAFRRRRSRKSNRPGIPRVTEKSVVFSKLRCDSIRNGSSSFGLCSSAHFPHLGHISDDADYSYSDGEVIYEEIDNKIVRLPEEKELTVKLVPQNIYVNNRGAVGGVGGTASGASCSGHKRRLSLPNEIYASTGATTHNPHYQEV